MVKLSKEDDMQQLCIEVRGVLAYCMNIEECMSVEVEANGKPWYHDIKAFIKNSGYPPVATDSEKKFIQRMACQFFLSGEVLYKRNHNSTLLRCVDASEANHLMEEMHEGLLGAYASGPLNLVPYRPQMNGAMEAANKNIKKILVKMTDTYKDWHEYLPFVLCTYCTYVRTSIGATPYSLVYGMEAVLPEKVEIPSLRILSLTELLEAKWAHSQYEQLNMIDEMCMTAMCHGQLYQRRVKRAFNKKVRPRVFEEGDLVLKKHN
ncbi:uncharacterized protein LOC142628759 [Castanea sativa]|uniref:uncharacterized protein LOC142628759 n=1 Tax=Castanea sativa TaxID=21020 RepID=UPI003F652986